MLKVRKFRKQPRKFKRAKKAIRRCGCGERVRQEGKLCSSCQMVFVGLTQHDYDQMKRERARAEAIDPFLEFQHESQVELVVFDPHLWQRTGCAEKCLSLMGKAA